MFGYSSSQTYFWLIQSCFSEMNDEFEVTVKWDNGEEDVVYITDLIFDKTLFVYFLTDRSWTAKVTQIFDWNDFEVLWEKDETKNCVTTKDVCPLNLDEFLGETVKWRDDWQIHGKIIRIEDKTIENKKTKKILTTQKKMLQNERDITRVTASHLIRHPKTILLTKQILALRKQKLSQWQTKF